MKPLEEAGFFCPKLNFALRNPVTIADYAQTVVQEGHKHSLDRVLRSQISILKNATNMAQGQLEEIGIIHHTPKEALRAAIEEIPHGKYGLFFIDNYEELETKNILDTFSDRPTPVIYTGQEQAGHFQNWLCEPEKKKNDVIMIGTQHQSNGIETELVVHIYVANCPSCGTSNADPVIISRAKAMLILSTYERQNCTVRDCGWNQNDVEVRWRTPSPSMEEDDQPLIEDNALFVLSQSPFWNRLLLLCKKRWKLLLSVLLTLVIGTSILIGYWIHWSHIGIDLISILSSFVMGFFTNLPLTP